MVPASQGCWGDHLRHCGLLRAALEQCSVDRPLGWWEAAPGWSLAPHLLYTRCRTLKFLKLCASVSPSVNVDSGSADTPGWPSAVRYAQSTQDCA